MALGKNRWWTEQVGFCFFIYFTRVGLASLALTPQQDSMCKGWWREDKTCFKALIKVQAVFLCWHLISAAWHPWGYACCCWGMFVREAFQAYALHKRGSYSTGQVSVQAQGSLPSVKTNRAVIFSSSAYRNWKFSSCPFLLAENRQLRQAREATEDQWPTHSWDRRELLEPRLFLTCFCCTLAVVSLIAFLLLCVSVCLCSSFLPPRDVWTIYGLGNLPQAVFLNQASALQAAVTQFIWLGNFLMGMQGVELLASRGNPWGSG